MKGGKNHAIKHTKQYFLNTGFNLKSLAFGVYSSFTRTMKNLIQFKKRIIWKQ